MSALPFFIHSSLINTTFVFIPPLFLPPAIQHHLFSRRGGIFATQKESFLGTVPLQPRIIHTH